MDKIEVLSQVFELIIYPVVGIVGAALVKFIQTKIDEVNAKMHNNTVQKYLDMLQQTVANCVVTTTQTYVTALKEQDAFDEAAQHIAFEKTYNAVIQSLTVEARQYLNEVIEDLDTYIRNQIECQVFYTKQ